MSKLTRNISILDWIIAAGCVVAAGYFAVLESNYTYAVLCLFGAGVSAASAYFKPADKVATFMKRKLMQKRT
jgi:NADH:ubiquinone oxidoreductase subunit 6 (subunit J)